ncbi:hypothetical protein ACFY05_32395 [Microtetraspora fusca]|uniref:Uncharacterized protein n=1 Tax=Microtetraspora fusca TaxID=1997 RepID=A0ABW6VEZ4_MICFU
MSGEKEKATLYLQASVREQVARVAEAIGVSPSEFYDRAAMQAIAEHDAPTFQEEMERLGRTGRRAEKIRLAEEAADRGAREVRGAA